MGTCPEEEEVNAYVGAIQHRMVENARHKPTLRVDKQPQQSSENADGGREDDNKIGSPKIRIQLRYNLIIPVCSERGSSTGVTPSEGVRHCGVHLMPSSVATLAHPGRDRDPEALPCGAAEREAAKLLQLR